jgi:hypothetical protein
LDERLAGPVLTLEVQPAGVVILRGSVLTAAKLRGVDLTESTTGMTPVVDQLAVVQGAKVIETASAPGRARGPGRDARVRGQESGNRAARHEGQRQALSGVFERCTTGLRSPRGRSGGPVAFEVATNAADAARGTVAIRLPTSEARDTFKPTPAGGSPERRRRRAQRREHHPWRPG